MQCLVENGSVVVGHQHFRVIPPQFNGKNYSRYMQPAIPGGDQWQGKRILFHTDNPTDVAIWNKQSTKSPKLMAIARKLFLVSALYDFEVKLTHIEGRLNPISDSLSRLQMLRFRQLHPDAEEKPTILDPKIWDDLLPK